MREKAILRLNLRGRLHEWSSPAVMGIINVTPDSFFGESRVGLESVRDRAESMALAGATILDIGGCSTRPGSDEPTESEELRRVVPAVKSIREVLPDIALSVDTFRVEVARQCIEAGADIVNDISGGRREPEIFHLVAEKKAPFILTHSRGNAATMQSMTDYEDIVAEVLECLAFGADRLHQAGVADVICDPGIGFAKTTAQNYALLGGIRMFKEIGPVLTGVSRKSLITRVLGTDPENALNGTTALNMIALMNGTSILRVHDVGAAVETVKLYEAYKANNPRPGNIITDIRRTGERHTEAY